MKLQTTAQALREAVQTAARIVSQNATTVAHTGVLVHVKGAVVSVVGSDSETTIAARLAATDLADGQVLLPPKPLLTYLMTLDPETPVFLATEDTSDVTLRAASSPSYRLRPIAATFALPPAPHESELVVVDLSRLSRALAAVRHAAGREDAVVQFVADGAGLALYTTDQYRLAAAYLPEARLGDLRAVVSLGVAEQLARAEVTRFALSGGTVSAEGPRRARTLWATNGQMIISSRLNARAFPAVEQVLSREPLYATSINRQATLRALARLEGVAGTRPVRLELGAATLRITASSPDLGEGTEEVEATKAPAKIEVLVNVSFLKDALAAHEADMVELGWESEVGHLTLTTTDPLAVTSVLMPVRE